MISDIQINKIYELHSLGWLNHHIANEIKVHSEVVRKFLTIKQLPFNRVKKKSKIEIYLNKRHSQLVLRAKKLNIFIDLSREDYKKQYYNQNGLCFYTDILLIYDQKSIIGKHSLSIDKIIPELGYTKGNIVFVTSQINTCKSNLSLKDIKKYMPSFYSRIKVFNPSLCDKI